MPSAKTTRSTVLTTMSAIVTGAGLAGSTALADGPSRFKSNIDGFGIARHSVEVQPGTTWAVSIDTDRPTTQMFVSTDARFSPHDAACGAERSCTVEVSDATMLYVFVMAEESTRYDVLATPTRIKASR